MIEKTDEKNQWTIRESNPGSADAHPETYATRRRPDRVNSLRHITVLSFNLLIK